MTDQFGNVWYGLQRIGALRADEQRNLYFAYDGEWLEKQGFPISIHLPLSNGGKEVDAHAFFEGLLPEGGVRQRVCRQLGIVEEDSAGLLFAIGEDCAGALTILPADVTPTEKWTPPKSLTTMQIEQLVRSPGAETATVIGRDQRFSLAGVQEKQPVVFHDDAYALPDRANPSSHILKFETLPWVCFAEYMANDMAHRIGLPVVATEFRLSGELEDAVPYLRIERYDRWRDTSGNLVRSHQEDILQALGEPAIFKYQRDGGPSLRNVAGLLREFTARPVEALEYLRDWQIFNYLIGNWDGHGKNLALLYLPGDTAPVLAPFYDLVTIEFLNLVRPHSWSRDMAFYIGEHNEPERISRTDWQGFARDLGIPPRPLLTRLEELTMRLPEVVRSSRKAFAQEYGDKPVYDKLEEAIQRRCLWTLNSVFAGS